MLNSQTKDTGQKEAPPEKGSAQAPAIQLPKGGGAIRGIGEKFAANPVTGTGSMTVPIATSPGRSGFGPQLSLSYDSGAGNGPFGFGWSLSLPSITRKTDKGLPKYQDAEESDVFILSDAEDLVPVLKEVNGKWELEKQPPRTVNGKTYRIQRYRPRIEGLFARIERWTNQDDPADTFWRSISKDNITTWYGKTEESRIFDPVDKSHIFSWLICESYDDKGNALLYEYKAEDSQGVDLAYAHERNRTDQSRSSNRYLKCVKYGNKTSRLTQPDLLSSSMKWLFEVVFDYDEGRCEELPGNPNDHQFVTARMQPRPRWPVRLDPFSSYRSGFEVRTYRLCHRVLMFHHFPDELGIDDYLVRSTEFTYSESPIASFITRVTQSGYRHQNDGTYLKKSLPPLEFEYSKADIQKDVRKIDLESLENLPYGLDGAQYQWVDLDGEGISGILTEQAGGWFYKRNLSPIPVKENGKEIFAAHFAPLEVVVQKPSLARVIAGQQQFLDLAGDGKLDLVQLERPLSGFYERTEDADWEQFRPFISAPNIDWGDPNLKFVDLTGDGHADILITEDEAFTWYRSLAEDGFDSAQKVHQVINEEEGPRLVFADGTQSIYLADISGDGLSDLVRIRNGEVSYWPNLGYGRFGKKVTMDNAPWFDHPELFDQRRIRLADIDGSGTTDIIYLAPNRVNIYRNQTGNSWASPEPLISFPHVDNLASVMATDLLGNGTACLVWSSPLPGDARRHMHYIDLMGGQKPHLLIKTVNNLGAETHVRYAPSTRFYVQDKLDGKPWITRLPFPVHCVQKVTVTDKWRQTRFSSTYSYHHGYFDGPEREFRGFGRVEQVDVESYGGFAAGNSASPYITPDKTLYQPPVKTVTWYHTGALLDRERILSQFEGEYFPNWFEELKPGEKNVLGDFQENILPEPDLAAEDLGADEWREALRACKGMMLRQEVYELDIDALELEEQRPVKLFTTAYHNCHIRRLQAKALNPYAVFLVAESEAITYHYELDLKPEQVKPDPRIAHTLNLNFDKYGNVLQGVAVVYPRKGKLEDDTDLAEGLADSTSLIRDVQQERHLAYTETRYTNDFEEKTEQENMERAQDNHRLPVPCEVLTYELTGIEPKAGKDAHFTIKELRALRLSPQKYQPEMPGDGLIHVEVIPYQQRSQPPENHFPEQRIVEHLRTLFFTENLVDPLPFREQSWRGLLYETYKLALTDSLLDAVFTDKTGNNKLDDTLGDATTARDRLRNAKISGYLSGADLVARFATLPAAQLAGQYWIRSGIAGFAPDAAEHFYLPERYEDPFGNVTTLVYDPRDLFVASSMDMLQNKTEVTQFDFRVLVPREMKDINDNLSEVYFDVLGLPTAMAVKGKGNEGDNLIRFDDTLASPKLDKLTKFFVEKKPYDESQAREWLDNATARHVYYFGEVEEKLPDHSTVIRWGQHPSCACGILREQHVSQLTPGARSPLQVAFDYSDGMGSIVVKKIQAEPEKAGQPMRWIANGKTILNNKGKPVKQYEPYFSAPEIGHRFEEPHEKGVTPVIYYDAVGRTVRTELPDGSFSRVEFSPWHVRTFDQNDTVIESKWYTDRNPPNPNQPLPRNPMTGELLVTPNQRAAWLAAQHRNTPSLTILDSLGREVISVAHNRVKDAAGGLKSEKYLTFTKLDAEGKPLWIRDARKNLVMQYITPGKPTRAADEPDSSKPENLPAESVPCYDIAGNLLFQHSMDAGDRWMLNDATGKPMLAWDYNERQDEAGTVFAENRVFFTAYDELHRPLTHWLAINGSAPRMIERFEYIDTKNNIADAHIRNLRGQLHRHFDASGLKQVERLDFKGNPLELRRQLAQDFKSPALDWQTGSVTAVLETETFAQLTEFDALNRMTRLYNWHRASLGSRVAVYEPRYSPRGLLAGETLILRATKTASGYVEGPQAQRTIVFQDIEYNAKGQKERIQYGNGTATRYRYDPETFRLRQLRTTRPGFDKPLPQAPSGLRDDKVLQNLYYTYDPVGNITENLDDAYEPVFFQNQKVEPVSRYAYDALYRLVEASGRESGTAVGPPPQIPKAPDQVSFPITNPGALRNYTQEYVHDAVGNIMTHKHQAGPTGSWTRDYTYASDSNRLLSTTHGDAVQNTTTYRYDSHGNLLNVANIAPAQSIRWDYRDMIHFLDLQGGGLAYYNHDAGKQRARKRLERLGGTVEERIALGGLEIYRKFTGGVLVEEIESIHLFEGRQRNLLIDDVLQTDNQNLNTGPLYRYQYNNHLGSSTLELDNQAHVISYEEYHPYGSTAYEAARSQTETPKRYRYTGKERDEETGFSYHGARYYAPWLGRWTSCDPTGIADGTNLYMYTKASPIRYVDPSGYQSHLPLPVDDWVLQLNQELGLDPAKSGQTPVIDLRPQAQPLSTPMSGRAAREYANKQAADFRAATDMNQGATVQAGHTAAARHASESGISRADWDKQPMQQLHSRKGQGLDVTLTDQSGNQSIRTRHTAQESLIDAAVDRSRNASGGTLKPQGQLDAANEVQWRTEGTGFDQREVDVKRQSGIFDEAAAIEKSPAVQARRAANATPTTPVAPAVPAEPTPSSPVAPKPGGGLRSKLGGAAVAGAEKALFLVAVGEEGKDHESTAIALAKVYFIGKVIEMVPAPVKAAIVLTGVAAAYGYVRHKIISGTDSALNEGAAATDPTLDISGRPYQPPKAQTLGQWLGF